MSNRTALLNKVYKVLKKHYKPITGEDRPLLEHMLYACVLENARPDSADEAFAKLQELFYDWNEVRVTTVAELTEVLSCLPDPAEAAGRLKRSLQSVFEAHYTFDLETLKKQALGKAEKELQKIEGASPFVFAYVIQYALGGHAIPINRGSMDVLYAVGVVNDAEADKFQVPGLERAIPKNKGREFGSLLQQLGSDFRASPGSSKLKAILAEMDSGFKERLNARQAHVEQAAIKKAADAAAAARTARAAAALEAKNDKSKKPGKPAGKEAPKGTAGKSAEKADKPIEKTPEKSPKAPPVDKSKKVVKKDTKGLAKKKPR